MRKSKIKSEREPEADAVQPEIQTPKIEPSLDSLATAAPVKNETEGVEDDAKKREKLYSLGLIVFLAVTVLSGLLFILRLLFQNQFLK